MSPFQQTRGVATIPAIIGISPHALKMREFAIKASKSEDTVLLEGETGVGKDHLVEAIHYMGRPTQRLVPVSCGNLQGTIFESEFFGHAKGAYTDAHQKKLGLIQLAERGTLFVDEIGELTPELQVRFLRILDKKSIWALGDTEEIVVNTRIIAATNKDLTAEVKAGRFRLDLFGRLNVHRFKILPLRERPEDIPHLAQHFLQQQEGGGPRTFTQEALNALIAYEWPENVREVSNVVKKILFGIPSDKTEIELEHVRPHLAGKIAIRLESIQDAAKQDRVRVMLDRMLVDGESFWEVVRVPFLARDITRDDVKAVVTEGLKLTHGHYKVLVRKFNMPQGDYKPLLNFLEGHRCKVAFQEFRNL